MKVSPAALLLALSASTSVDAFGVADVKKTARVGAIVDGNTAPSRRPRTVAMSYLDDLSADSSAYKPRSYGPNAGGAAPSSTSGSGSGMSYLDDLSAQQQAQPPATAPTPMTAPASDLDSLSAASSASRPLKGITSAITSAAAENLKELSDSMPDRYAVKSALSSFSSYMDDLSSAEDESEASKKARLEELEAALAQTKSRIESVAGEIDSLMEKAKAAAEQESSAQLTQPPPPPPPSTPPPPPPPAAAVAPAPRRSEAIPAGSTIPTSRSIVPVNESTIEFTSGLIAGIVGLALAGPVGGAVAALAANYASRTQGDLDAGDVIRSVSKSAIQVYNYLSRLDDKYRGLEKARESLAAAYKQLESEPNADPLYLRRIEQSLERTAARMRELNEKYDLVDSGFVALGVVGDLVEITLNKIDEVNGKYKLTDRAWSAVTNGIKGSKAPPPIDREW